MSGKLSLTVVLLATLYFCSDALAEEPHLPYSLKSAHFVIHTDVSRELLLHMAPFLEAAHVAIPKLPGFRQAFREDAVRTVEVFLFRDDASIASHAGRGGSVAFSHRGGGKIYVRGVPDSLYETRRRTLHELAHVYGRWTGAAAVPDILKESICDVVSWHYWDGKRLELCYAPNAPDFHFSRMLDAIPAMVLAERFDFTEPMTGAYRTVEERYAVAHFLLTNPAVTPSFASYVSSLRGSTSVPGPAHQAAINRFFAPRLTQLKLDFLEHCLRLTGTLRQARMLPVANLPCTQPSKDIESQRAQRAQYMLTSKPLDESRPSGKSKLTIRAFIDGETYLVVTRQGLHWEHVRFQRPGIESNVTTINGLPWEERWKDKFSDVYSLPMPLGEANTRAKVTKVAGRGHVALVGLSTVECLILFQDPEPGADWYEVVIEIGTPTELAP